MSMNQITLLNGALIEGEDRTFVIYPVDGEWLVGSGNSMEEAFDAIENYNGTVGDVVPYLTRDEAIGEAINDAGKIKNAVNVDDDLLPDSDNPVG